MNIQYKRQQYRLALKDEMKYLKKKLVEVSFDEKEHICKFKKYTGGRRIICCLSLVSLL